MAKAESQLQFFIDNNVPDSIGIYLRRRGHSVHLMRHHMPHDSKDPVVATAALQAGRILVTWDKDFNDQRFMQERFAGLSRLGLCGAGPTLLAAVKQHIHLIEYQWSHCIKTGAQRMIAHVKVDQIKFRN